jgi:oxygen-independent coproporphyrinogen III oxidase
MQGIYIHIPFCHRKCGYCDFNSYAGLDALVAPFVDALHREIERSPYAGARFDTVFFGGGTPTYLDGTTLVGILEHLTRRFAIAADAEITCEANPGSVSLEQLRTLRQAGFNRLSFGVQSFHPDELRRMERIHTPDEVVQGVEWARAAGFANLNLDLIFALPQQTLERWEASLQQAIALQPEHLSLYALMLEPNTRFYHLYQKGKLHLPDDETQVAMYRLAQQRTAQAGYLQYEISNYALPGYECQHNLIYWRNEPYLGFGPGRGVVHGGQAVDEHQAPARVYPPRAGGRAAGAGMGAAYRLGRCRRDADAGTAHARGGRPLGVGGAL